MQMAELQTKDKDALKDIVAGLRKELFNLRFQRATGELSNMGRFREVRRDIARIETRMSQLRLGIVEKAKAEPKAKKPKAEKAAKVEAKKEKKATKKSARPVKKEKNAKAEKPAVKKTKKAKE